MTYPHLSNAPIKEAVIEILVEAGDDFGLPQIEPLAGKVEVAYPRVGKRGQYTSVFRSEPGGKAQLEHSPAGQDGIVCGAPSKKKTVNFFIGGFSFHQQRPYDGWDVFAEEALRLWSVYEEVAKPKKIRRIGVRFLNFIEANLPLNISEILVNAAPQPVPGLSVGNFTTQVLVAKDPNRGPFANIVQSIQLASENEERVSVILDIDAFVQEPYAAQAIQERLVTLRDLKNEIFFNSVQPSKLKELA
jgi:uncharacterized protein (TIGR04255 family)